MSSTQGNTKGMPDTETYIECEEDEMEDEYKYHTFEGKSMKLKELLPMIRDSGNSNHDEGAIDIILCLECEEWTHVRINAHNALLDLLGDITITSINADDCDIRLWVKTDEFNWFRQQDEMPSGKE